MRQIKSFGVLQTAKFAAVFYLVTVAVFAIPAAIIGTVVAILSDELSLMPLALFLFAPLLYAAIGFVAAAIGCLVYNLIAGWIGGIEIELEDVPGDGYSRGSV